MHIINIDSLPDTAQLTTRKTNTSPAPRVEGKTVSDMTTRTETAHSFAAITTTAQAMVSAW